jgi:hypothetical protein
MGIGSIVLFVNPGPAGPEGGPFQAAFGLALLAAFHAAIAVLLIVTRGR